MIEKKTWEEFRESGILWYVNRTLHLLGYAIIFECDETTDELITVYPARVKFRGFSEESETRGFKRISQYLRENGAALAEEANE